jgi:alkanesulfonate monooxygenase SsuD/methylene tetrahydromethanopterin reductase-like flavin-dependent oxidoreductase (luciferase family)
MVGSRGTVRDGLHAFIEGTAADEIMIVSHIFDHAKRVRSYEIAADVRAELSQAGG